MGSHQPKMTGFLSKKDDLKQVPGLTGAASRVCFRNLDRWPRSIFVWSWKLVREKGDVRAG